MNEFEIAIVGGGPAGVSTALFLQALAPELARRTVVIEKSRYPREKICAGAIGARADKLLASIDVRVDVPSQPIRGLGVSSPRGPLVVRQDQVIGRVVRRKEFDQALADLAKARGIQCQEGEAVKSVSTSDAGVTLALEGGRTIACDAVIGADGVGSIVRRSLGLSRGPLSAQVVEIDSERTREDLAEDVLFFDLSDRGFRGYGWDFPTPLDGQTRVCRGAYELRDQPRGASGEESDRLKQALSRRLRGAKVVGKEKRFAERGLDLHSPLSRKRTLLIGEAAGIDPVLGEGIAQAISYGALAARYLVPRIRARDLRFQDWSAFVSRSTLGLDLRARRALIPLVYGRGRPLLERWVGSSEALAQVGMSLFSGARPSLSPLARAALDLLLAPFA